MPRIDPSRNIVERITRFNEGRDPDRLALKFAAMRDSPFAFLRGTCHLFHEDLPVDLGVLRKAPAAWICGDLHLENFSSFKGDNRLTYFDINDFDEACLAPLTWDAARFVTSLLVAADGLELRRRDALALCRHFLDTYAATLGEGKARWLERDTAQGMVADLLQGVGGRSRVEFLDTRSRKSGGRRRLRVDGDKALPATEAQQQRVARLVEGVGRKRDEQKFFRVIDCARRIAGTGSLGIARFVVLVKGKGSPDGNYLLDLKHQPGSALAPYLRLEQPGWNSEARRVIAIQQRMQAISPSFLWAVRWGDRSFTLRELLPSQDRLKLDAWDGALRRLESVVGDMARIAAWDHLRAAGREGAAGPDELIAFGQRAAKWSAPLLDYARHYAEQVERDWRSFRDSHSDADA